MIITAFNLLISIVILVLLIKSTTPTTSIKLKKGTDLYVFSMKNNNKTFRFIIDSGATQSLINKDSLKDLKYSETKFKSSYYGVEGNYNDTNIISAEFQYANKYRVIEHFMIANPEIFEKLKENHGNIDGILGLTFLEATNSFLNFNNQTINFK